MIDEILKLNDEVGTLTAEEKKSMQQIQEFVRNKINKEKRLQSRKKKNMVQRS